MKYWLRRFKTSPDVVAAETEEEAMQMDSSGACDTVEVDDVREINRGFVERSHPSWREYLPEGDPDYRTLAEIFGLVPESQEQRSPESAK